MIVVTPNTMNMDFSSSKVISLIFLLLILSSQSFVFICTTKTLILYLKRAGTINSLLGAHIPKLFYFVNLSYWKFLIKVAD